MSRKKFMAKLHKKSKIKKKEKKKLITLKIILATAVSFCALCFTPVEISSVVWNGQVDKDVAVTVDSTKSARTNASGNKITSNAHSADYPGIYFIWDAKQKDNGYLKVAAEVLDVYLDSFVLTTKSGNAYEDFIITLQSEQQRTPDGNYSFFIPKVQAGAKNINMVFIEVTAKTIDCTCNENPFTEEEMVVIREYGRYRAYVQLWNDIREQYRVPGTDTFADTSGVNVVNFITNQGAGLTHYHSLLAYYGAQSLPPYYAFDFAMLDIYEDWADQLEVGIFYAIANGCTPDGHVVSDADSLKAFVESFGDVIYEEQLIIKTAV